MRDLPDEESVVYSMAVQMERTLFAATLARYAAACEAVLAAYTENHPDAPHTPFGSAILLVNAALTTVVDLELDDPRRDVALMIASTLSRETAEKIRRHGLDEQLLRCAVICEDAADLCDRALD